MYRATLYSGCAVQLCIECHPIGVDLRKGRPEFECLNGEFEFWAWLAPICLVFGVSLLISRIYQNKSLKQNKCH